MKITVLIIVALSLAIILWVAYSHYRRRRPELLAALADSPVSVAPSSLNSLRLSAESAHWAFINQWQLVEQSDDRRPMNGSVPRGDETTPSNRRSLARRSHQLNYKKWSQARHE